MSPSRQSGGGGALSQRAAPPSVLARTQQKSQSHSETSDFGFPLSILGLFKFLGEEMFHGDYLRVQGAHHSQWPGTDQAGVLA